MFLEATPLKGESEEFATFAELPSSCLELCEVSLPSNVGVLCLGHEGRDCLQGWGVEDRFDWAIVLF